MRKLLVTLSAVLITSAALAASASATSPIEKLPSGVTIQKSKSVANGASPKATDTVKVHYAGTLLNGTEFDSSYKRGAPATFPLDGVIPCWTQGVQKMKVGEKAKLVCPSDTAYGPMGIPGTIPPNSTLNFEVELLSIEK